MGLFDSIGSNLSGMVSSAASTISAAASNISNAVSSTFGGGNSPSSGNNQQSGSPKSGSPTPSPTPTPSSDKSPSSSGGSSSSGAPYAPAAVDYSSLTVTPKSSSGGSTTQKSPSSSSNSLTKTPENVTVQPVFISAGKGGVSYDITYADGTQNGIAVSGISLSESVDYYLQKSAEAEARGDTEKAAKYAKNARDFAAAANYEAASGIMNEYGKSTGVSYDATAATRLNESTWQSYVDPAAVVQYDKSYVRTPATSYYAPMTVSTTLGESPAPANTTTLTGSGNSTPITTTPLRYEWDNSKSFWDNLTSGYSYNLDQSLNYTQTKINEYGLIPGLISGFGGTYNASHEDGLENAIRPYFEESNRLLESDDPDEYMLGLQNSIMGVPNLAEVYYDINRGITPSTEKLLYAGFDIATLAFGAGAVAKAGKLIKLGKPGVKGLKGAEEVAEDISKLEKVEDAAGSGLRIGDTAEDAAKAGKTANNATDALNAGKTAEKGLVVKKALGATSAAVTVGGLVGLPIAVSVLANNGDEGDPNQGGEGDDGNKDGIIDQNEKPQKVWDYDPYHWEYNPDEQRQYSEQDLSDILSAALAGLYGNQTAGGAGGGGDITIVNETPAASSSSSDWFEQIKPYIIPALIAIVVIALITLSGKDGKKAKSKGARA